MLALDDLVQDENGEVVLFNDSGLAGAGGQHGHDRDRGGRGRAAHVTAAGEDVSGFRYIAVRQWAAALLSARARSDRCGRRLPHAG